MSINGGYLKLLVLENSARKLQPITSFFILSNILDLITTIIALNLGAVEVGSDYINYGWTGFLLIKIFAVLLPVFYYEFCSSYLQSKLVKALIFIVFIPIIAKVTIVVFENIWVIAQLLFC